MYNVTTHEQPTGPERIPTKREDVLESLKANIQNPNWELFDKWVKERAINEKTIKDHKEYEKASINFSIENAQLLMEAGLLQEAYDELNETIDYAVGVQDYESHDHINDLMDEIKEKLGK